MSKNSYDAVTDGRKIYIGNLHPNVVGEELKALCENYGCVVAVWVARRPPGFAFVTFESARDAEYAVRSLDGDRHFGTSLRVEIARGPDREGRGGGDRGRRRSVSPYDRSGRGGRRGRSPGYRGSSPGRHRSPQPYRGSPSYVAGGRGSPVYGGAGGRGSPSYRDGERSPAPEYNGDSHGYRADRQDAPFRHRSRSRSNSLEFRGPPR